MKARRTRLGLALMIALLAVSSAAAQEPVAVPDAIDSARRARLENLLASPRDTMETFLVAMNELWTRPEAWGEAVACLDLARTDADMGRERARQLYAVLNRIEEIDVADLPGPEAGAADEDGRHRYFPEPRRHRQVLARIGTPAGGVVFERDADGLWRFSADTLSHLPALYSQIKSLEVVAGREILTLSDWIESRLPASLVDGRILTVKYWVWIVIFVVILLGLLVDAAVRAGLRLVSRRLSDRLHSEEDPEQLRRTLRPIGLAAAAVVWLSAMRFVELEPAIDLLLRSSLRIFLVLAGTVSAWRLIDLGASFAQLRAERTSTRIDDILVPLVTRAVKLFVLVIGGIYAADALDIPIAPLLASLTVAGVGFSFAAKDTVENFFGSVAVVLDRPFDIGDWVVIGDTEGIVEQVGFRSTRIRTFYNSLITVPNSNLVRAEVDNYGRRTYRRWKTTLGLQYDTRAEQLVAFTEGIRELIRTHPYTRKDYYQVWCNDFGASSLDVMLYLFFEVPDWNTELRERERLFLDIVRLANQLGVQFAFPTQTLHVFPGEPGAAPAEAPGAATERTAEHEGIQAAQRLIRDQPWRRAKPGPVVIASGPTQVALDDGGNPVEADGESRS